MAIMYLRLPAPSNTDLWNKIPCVNVHWPKNKLCSDEQIRTPHSIVSREGDKDQGLPMTSLKVSGSPGRRPSPHDTDARTLSKSPNNPRGTVEDFITRPVTFARSVL